MQGRGKPRGRDQQAPTVGTTPLVHEHDRARLCGLEGHQAVLTVSTTTVIPLPEFPAIHSLPLHQYLLHDWDPDSGVHHGGMGSGPGRQGMGRLGRPGLLDPPQRPPRLARLLRREAELFKVELREKARQVRP
jgi:hypothetical protein